MLLTLDHALSSKQFASDLRSDVALCSLNILLQKQITSQVGTRDNSEREHDHPSSTSLTSCNQSTHGGHHGDSSMLQLHGSSALERRHVTVGGEPYGIPKSNRSLHSQLVLKGSQSNLSRITGLINAKVMRTFGP